MSRDGSNNQNPWGKRPEQGPPDLIELIKKFFSNVKKPASGSPSSSASGNPLPWSFRTIISAVVAIFLFIWIVAGIYIVKPAEQAVILRFGKYIGVENAGPHWIPPMIETRYIVNTQQVQNFPFRADMLTNDENIVSVAVAVQYRIADPKQYLFDVVRPVHALEQAASSALRQVVGEMSLNDVLTKGRAALRENIATQLNHVLSRYKTGLVVTDVTLQPAKPPEAVTGAFDDAIKAREDEQRYINQASAYVNQVTSTATGKVARLTQSANAYRQEVVLRATGQTERFLALYHAYKNAPTVTRERLYLEAMQDMLSKTHNVIVDGNQNNMMYLPLNAFLKQQEKPEKIEKNSTGSADHNGGQS